jgi:hypothetical protein
MSIHILISPRFFSSIFDLKRKKHKNATTDTYINHALYIIKNSEHFQNVSVFFAIFDEILTVQNTIYVG